MAKKNYKCFDCGATFTEQYRLLLHYDLHKGEPVVREAGCFCGDNYDIRMGYCQACGYVHSTGWRVVAGAAK